MKIMIVINLFNFSFISYKSKFCHYPFVLMRAFIPISIFFVLLGCSDKKAESEYPIIDVVGSVEKYQRVYCSDYFSSIELIPLETREDCLLQGGINPNVVLKDSFIFMRGSDNLYAFSTSGKFLNQIGSKGQGPGEYIYSSRFFLSTDKSVIYVEDLTKILEYDFNGNHISTIQRPSSVFSGFHYAGNGVFICSIYNDGKNKYKYYLLNQNGEFIDSLPNYVFFNREIPIYSTHDTALLPIRVDNKLYLKDFINDTLYILEDSKLQPTYIFGLGNYSYPIENLVTTDIMNVMPRNSFFFQSNFAIVGMPELFFYLIHVPNLFSKPQAKPTHNTFTRELTTNNSNVYGIYNIVEKTNILLDTDDYGQKGIINDINGGLPVIPRYYAGDGVVVCAWEADNMKEMLTDEYFASQNIKDQQAHQKLKEILKNLKADDNPVVVIAKLK